MRRSGAHVPSRVGSHQEAGSTWAPRQAAAVGGGGGASRIRIDLQQPKTQPVYAVESAIVYAASGSSVTTTICDGKVLMRNRKVLTVDVPAAVAKAKVYRDRVVKSLSVDR